MSLLFSEQIINQHITAKNRLVMSPMCQYLSPGDGSATEEHLVHYGSRAIGGVGTIIQEATAVLPEGRISYADLGIWEDAHIPPLKKIVSFIKKHGAIAGIQLAHAGRKASCNRPWDNGGGQISADADNGWQTVAPTNQPFLPEEEAPKALTIEEIERVIDAFKRATLRSIDVGYEIIEIHAAHGYLIHQFLSPLINDRQDQYGGSFENRIRLLLEIVTAIQSLLTTQSLWVRISASEWVENGWDIDDSIQLAKILEARGVDLIDVSSGGGVPEQSITLGRGYQVPFAKSIKETMDHMLVGAVGLIVSAEEAEAILESSSADLVFLGRELLYNPYFPMQAQFTLDGKYETIDSYRQTKSILRYK